MFTVVGMICLMVVIVVIYVSEIYGYPLSKLVSDFLMATDLMCMSFSLSFSFRSCTAQNYIDSFYKHFVGLQPRL